jgi:hypothetical protein
VKQLAKIGAKTLIEPHAAKQTVKETVPSNKGDFCEPCRCSPSLFFAESISKEFYACDINNK